MHFPCRLVSTEVSSIIWLFLFIQFLSGALITSETPQVEMFGIPWPDYFYLLAGSVYSSPQTLYPLSVTVVVPQGFISLESGG